MIINSRVICVHYTYTRMHICMRMYVLDHRDLIIIMLAINGKYPVSWKVGIDCIGGVYLALSSPPLARSRILRRICEF